MWVNSLNPWLFLRWNLCQSVNIHEFRLDISGSFFFFWHVIIMSIRNIAMNRASDADLVAASNIPNLVEVTKLSNSLAFSLDKGIFFLKLVTGLFVDTAWSPAICEQSRLLHQFSNAIYSVFIRDRIITWCFIDCLLIKNIRLVPFVNKYDILQFFYFKIPWVKCSVWTHDGSSSDIAHADNSFLFSSYLYHDFVIY